MCVQWDNTAKVSTLSYFYNNVQTSSTTFSRIFIDSFDNVHLIGIENDSNGIGRPPVKSNGLVGFIYRLCFYSGYIIETEIFGPECGLNQCDSCPEDICLNNCPFRYYRDSRTERCSPCLPACELGCVKGTNCDPCLDGECAECQEWDVCESCEPLTNRDLNNCECIDFHFYDEPAD